MKNSKLNNSPPDPGNEPEETLNEMISLVDQNKGEEIVTINLEPALGYDGRFLIVSALSGAHLKKLSDEIYHMMKRRGELPGRVPGNDDFESGWVILDYGNIVVHFFLPEKRRFYNLEELWNKGTLARFHEGS